MSEAAALTTCAPKPVPAGVDLSQTTWRLHVGGLVEQPGELTIESIRALPATSLANELLCRGGTPVPGLCWLGVTIGGLLAHVGVATGATKVRIGSDGYSIAVRLEQLAQRPFLLAYEMNHAPLTPEAGAPLRLVAPENVCAHSIKWVNRVTVTE